MGLTAVVTAKSGGSDYPTLAFDGTNGHRIAFVGPNRFPDLAESGSPLLVGDEDEAAPYTYFQHWTPDGLIAGGNRSFKCIGKQNNCLFCELQWRSGRSNLVNVVAYEGYDMKKQTFEGKKVVAFQAPTKVIQDAVTHSSTMGVAFDSIDYFVNKEGTGKTGTKWIVTPIPNVIDQTFDPMELPEQNEGFADEEFPFLVDYFKFDQLQIENRAEQEEAYKKLVGDTTTETAAAPPPGQPLATAAAPVTAPAGGPVALPGKKKGGRPSNAAKAAAAAGEFLRLLLVSRRPRLLSLPLLLRLRRFPPVRVLKKSLLRRRSSTDGTQVRPQISRISITSWPTRTSRRISRKPQRCSRRTIRNRLRL